MKTKPVTDAIIAALTAALPAGILVGDGDKPVGAGWQGTPGASDYVAHTIVDPIPGGILDGDLADSYNDAELLVALRHIAARRSQAEHAADLARTIVLNAALDISGSGHQVIQVGFDAIGGTRRDADVDPPVFVHAGDRFRIFTTPTS